QENLNDARSRRLELSASGVYAGTVLAVHATAAACVLATITGVPGMALAFLVIALGAAAAWDRALLRGPRSPRAIELPASGTSVAVILANGQVVPLRAVRGIGVTRHWVALRPRGFAGGGVLVMAGMLAPAAHRVLRLWALWGRTPRAAPAQLPA
ncbi:MAG: hypothetical protein ABI654_07235, partial [Betaproteobacteria bacterium]